MSDYSIVISRITQTGLQLDYELDTAFFAAAPAGSLSEVAIHAHLDLHKVREGIRAKVQLNGNIGTNCDRCLQCLNYTIDSTESLLYTTSTKLADENPTTVVLIEEEQAELDFTQDLFDLSLLQLPHKKACDKVGPQCDLKTLEAIEQLGQAPADTDQIDPRWEALRNLNNDN